MTIIQYFADTLLEKLADEALAEHRAGLTKSMAFADDGKIVPAGG